MKTTKFDQTIAMGVFEFIKFLENTLAVGKADPEVPAEIYTPAVKMMNEIHDSIEKYSETMLKIYGTED